jgi:uncharacterized protein (DUF433 family)
MKDCPTKRVELVPDLVVSDPAIQKGDPVFAGTCVPVQTLIEYWDGSSPLYEFVLDFPEVGPVQAKRFIEWWAEQERLGVRDILSWLMSLRDQAQQVPF